MSGLTICIEAAIGMAGLRAKGAWKIMVAKLSWYLAVDHIFHQPFWEDKRYLAVS